MEEWLGPPAAAPAAPQRAPAAPASPRRAVKKPSQGKKPQKKPKPKPKPAPVAPAPDTMLTRCGYCVLRSSLTPADLRRTARELTVAPIIRFCPGGIPPAAPRIKNFSMANIRVHRSAARYPYLVVPKFYGLDKFGAPEKDCVSSAARIVSFEFSGRLRDDPPQTAASAAVVEACLDPLRRGALLSLPCGWGKTAIAIHCMCRLRRKTLIVVHKSFLLNQWRERLETFAPGSRVGLLKTKKMRETGDEFDVTIASLQTLLTEDFDGGKNLSGYGLVVYDEVHRIASECFSKVYGRVTAEYTIGLSATMQRSDGLSCIFQWAIGPVVFSAEREADSDVDVRVLRCEERCGEESYSSLVTAICESPARNEMLAGAIMQAVDSGRNTIVVSDRLGQLQALAEYIGARGYGAGMYVGGMKPGELEESSRRNVILATYGVAAEGLDIQKLDTLVMASPKSSIEQTVGRILRTRPEHRRSRPTVVDVIDQHQVLAAQFRKRNAYYSSQEYSVTFVEDGEGVF